MSTARGRPPKAQRLICAPATLKMALACDTMTVAVAAARFARAEGGSVRYSRAISSHQSRKARSQSSFAAPSATQWSRKSSTVDAGLRRRIRA